MLRSNKIVLIGARFMVRAHYSVYHSMIKKFLSLSSSFNMKKLLTTAACATEKWKAGANAQRPSHAGGWLLFLLKDGAY